MASTWALAACGSITSKRISLWQKGSGIAKKGSVSLPHREVGEGVVPGSRQVVFDEEVFHPGLATHSTPHGLRQGLRQGLCKVWLPSSPRRRRPHPHALCSDGQLLTFEPSSRAAAAVGPKQAMPAAAHLSASPAQSGASGPTATSSTFSAAANSTSFSSSESCRTARASESGQRST